MVGKEFPAFPSHLQRRRSPQKRQRNSTVVPPFPESQTCLSPFQGNLFSLHCLEFQAEDRLTPRWHVGQPCGKASWESLVGKPRGKFTDPLIHAKGSTRVRPTSRGAPFPSPSSRGGILSLRVRERIPGVSSRISRGGALHRKGERISRVVPPFPESPRCLSPFRETCFPCSALTFKPRIDSHHGGTWDSSV